ncbi:MAG: hypothetical protein IKL25_03535 [Clostridia bacterium]|nr:hypothetical protein [Clostridia bacterium]
MSISQKDREILRDLAKRQLELAASKRNQQLYQDWMAYGASKTPVGRPLIRIETDSFAQEIIPPMMKCEGDEARRIEWQMLRPIANFTLFEDDTLVPDYFEVLDHYQFTPFNLPVKSQQTGGLGHHFIPYLHDLEEDDHLLGKSPFAVREDWAQQRVQQAVEIFGDILPVKRVSNAAYCTPMQDIVHIMNMDDMYIAMIDDEERFDAMLGRLVDDYIEFFQAQEDSGTLHTGARMQHLCQGSYCFTNELQDDLPGAKNRDRWLFMDSQETAGVSPEMYRDLVFPHYKRVMDRFGLISYGCCEATHPIWDDCLSKLPHLRKVSISPWCNEEFMGERLLNTGVTYLRKPPATILGMNTPVLDEEATLACFRKTAKAAKGCKLEIAQRDVYTVGNNPDKVKRFVQLARIGLEG